MPGQSSAVWGRTKQAPPLCVHGSTRASGQRLCETRSTRTAERGNYSDSTRSREKVTRSSDLFPGHGLDGGDQRPQTGGGAARDTIRFRPETA